MKKAPFGLFIRDREGFDAKTGGPTKRSKRLSDRQILKELSRLLSVSESDIPKTLERFKKDVEEMQDRISEQQAL